MLPIEEALLLVRRLCSPLAYIHGEGVIHRDLKPDNVLITGEGQPVLVDFGLVSRYGGDVAREVLQSAGAVSGTGPYMAPEQWRGELPDARTDLYALGCILYELLVGRPPFVSGSRANQAAMHQNIEPVPPSSRRSGVPPELDDLVMGLLAKDPRRRIGHAETVAATLAELGAGADTAAGSTPEVTGPTKAYLYRPALAGREDALAQWREALDALKGGQGGLVLIGGESGVGKTRLMTEMAGQAFRARMEVLQGRCEESERGLALNALRRPLQTVGDRCRERGLDEAERLLGRRGPVLAQYEPSLRSLPGQEEYDEPADLPMAAARLRLCRYLTETLAELGARQPVVVMLDDLQWADPLTIEVLHHLGQSEPRPPVLVVGSYRVEERVESLVALEERDGVLSLRIDRLDEAAVGTIVQDMLGLASAPPEVTSFLASHSEGVPFYVAEYLKLGIQSGLLVRDERGEWRLGPADEASGPSMLHGGLPLPGPLRELVKRRLDLLGGGTRSVVDAASVIGRELDRDLLFDVLQRAGVKDREPSVRELVRLQILEELPTERLQFNHDKLREVSYEELAPGRRKLLHLQAAHGIESRYPEAEIGPHLAGLGSHWERAGEPQRARGCYLPAAQAAAKRYALEEAERLYRAYLRLVPEPTAESAQARESLARSVLDPRGRWEDAMAELETALQEARAVSDRHRQASVMRNLAELHIRQNRIETAQQLLADAIEVASADDDPSMKGALALATADLENARGRFEEALAQHDRAASLFQAAGAPWPQGGPLTARANVLKALGRTEEASHAYQTAIEITRRDGDRIHEIGCLSNYAIMRLAAGRLEEGGRLLTEVLAVVTEVGHRRGEGAFHANLGGLRQAQGDFEAARTHHERAIEIASELGDRRLEGLSRSNLGVLHYVQARPQEAASELHLAIAGLKEAGDTVAEGDVLTRLALVEGQLGEIDRAVSRFRELRGRRRGVDGLPAPGSFFTDLADLELLHSEGTEEAARLTAEAEAAFQAHAVHAEADPTDLQSLACVRGHIALAEGRSAGPFLTRIDDLTRGRAPEDERLPSHALPKLERAQACFEAGTPLVCGIAPEDITAGQYRWLIQHRPHAIPDAIRAVLDQDGTLRPPPG